MRRRTLLATIPALATLSGCNARNLESSPGDDGRTATTTATTDSTTSETTAEPATETTAESTTESTTETPTTVPEPEYPRFVDIDSIESTDYSGLEFDARIHTDRIDAERTASVSATLENTGDTRLKLQMGYRPPFSKVRCENGGYLLVKPAWDGEFDPCWEPPGPRGQPALLSMKELDPGEDLTASMKLIGDPRTDACLPTGTFRFVSHFEVTREGETKGRANAFTIRVSKT